MQRKFSPRLLPLILAALWAAPSAAQPATTPTLNMAQAQPDQNANAQTLGTVRVQGEKDDDEKGHDDVYDENVTTVYKGREELQRFQVTSPGDIFKGMDGVYSMDTRSSQAITPNIRSISGEGRVPLTIDGTEQSTNIWLHMFGAGNRSYADPALFRSVEVEKGPSLSRSVKSGVGGAVSIRTIEASDIIPDGDSWGIEFKADSSSNSVKPNIDANSYFGKDYRTLQNARLQEGSNVVIPTEVRNKGNNQRFNFDSYSGMLAAAWRNDKTDLLVSYSKRTQGNYFAGKKHDKRYQGHDPYDKSTTDSYIPNVTKLYEAGDEVFNTASESKTTLIKNNWYLPNEQKVSLQFMQNKLTFGETTPGDSVLMWGYREAAEQAQPDFDWKNAPRFVAEKPHSQINVRRYKIDYEVKPQNSRWLNLETSLWHTKTTGTRHQTGITPYGIIVDDDTKQALIFDEFMREAYPEYYTDDIPRPDHDGTIFSNGHQWTKHDRTGLDLSNQMQLTQTLQLTVAGNFQREKLNDLVYGGQRESNSILPDGASNHMITDRIGPRSGKRSEYSGMMNFSYQPTSWLTLTAGARYMRYTGKDTAISKRRQQDEFYQATQRLAGLQLRYEELMTPEDAVTLANLRAAFNNASAAVDRNDPANFKRWDYIYHATGGDMLGSINHFATENQAVRVAARNLFDFLTSRSANRFPSDLEHTVLNADGTINTDPFEKGLFVLFSSGVGGVSTGNYWLKSVLLPNKDGKFDSSKNPFATGEADATELVDDPYNPGTTVARYRTHGNYGTTVYKKLAAGQEWEMDGEQSGHAWSPVLSATMQLSDFSTAFLRYAQTTRFPSVYELTSSSIVDGAGTLGTMAINGANKPERSVNVEIGYAHDLTQFLPQLHFADARISYYNTEIKNFIDRTNTFDTIQFDKKKSSGIELQARFDQGWLFGSMGATHRLKQKTCDKDYASAMDPYYNRIPHCMTGGFPGNYSGSSLLPKQSINMALGTRLLNNNLEIGWRGEYHSSAKNNQLDGLLAQNAMPAGMNSAIRNVWFRDGGVDAFFWKSVFLHDVYARYALNKNITLNLNVTNLTDEYYLDPMAKTVMPGPGRTITAGLTVNF